LFGVSLPFQLAKKRRHFKTRIERRIKGAKESQFPSCKSIAGNNCMLIPKIYFLNYDLLHIRQQLSGAVRQESSSPYPPFPQLIKYNLMEETYGKRWNKRPQMYFLSNDCTAGKLKLISSIDYWYRKSQLNTTAAISNILKTLIILQRCA
jgi:hypothetical protein